MSTEIAEKQGKMMNREQTHLFVSINVLEMALNSASSIIASIAREKGTTRRVLRSRLQQLREKIDFALDVLKGKHDLIPQETEVEQ